MRSGVLAAILFGLLFGWLDLVAQEFWMMPDRFDYKRGDTIRIKFNVGENFVGDVWNLRPERIKSVSVTCAGRSSDLSGRVITGRGDHLLVPATVEGSYVISMESNSVFVEVPAAQFNEYLKEYALDNASTARSKNHTSDDPGRELYSRNTKLIVHVGAKIDEGYQTHTSLPLEIIPGKNTLQIKKGEMVQFKILFNGKPEFGLRAFVWNSKDNRIFMQPIYSQQDGTIDVRIFNDGRWMISVVKMVPAADKRADWQSCWSSLVFNVN